MEIVDPPIVLRPKPTLGISFVSIALLFRLSWCLVVSLPKLRVKSLDAGKILIVTALEHGQVCAAKLFLPHLIQSGSEPGSDPPVDARQ